jgi:hypothetical protein
MKIPPIEGYTYKLYGYDELIELVSYYNSYNPQYIGTEYVESLLIASNTKPVIALVKNMYEEKSDTNFAGSRKSPLQASIVRRDRRKLKEYFEKIRLLTGDEIFVTNSYTFGEQNGIRMKFGSVSSITEIKETIDTDITNISEKVVNCLKNFHLPMKQNFLEGARKNLDYSYNHHFNGIAVTMVVTALETLLIKNGSFSKKFSEFIPQFYKNENDNQEIIANEVKNLYKLRCEIVHEGKFQKGTTLELKKLRRHTRKVLLILNELNKSKDEVIKILKDKESDEFTKCCRKYDFI